MDEIGKKGLFFPVEFALSERVSIKSRFDLLNSKKRIRSFGLNSTRSSWRDKTL